MTDPQMGWECKKCGASRSPLVDGCPCSPAPQQSPLFDLNSTPTTASTTPTTAPHRGGGKVLGLRTKTQRQRQSYEDPDFQRFWDVYPYKVGKRAAYLKWLRHVVEAGVGVDEVVEGALRYAADPKRDPAFTKYPEGWLAAGRWADEASAAPPPSHQIGAGLTTMADREAEWARAEGAE